MYCMTLCGMTVGISQGRAGKLQVRDHPQSILFFRVRNDFEGVTRHCRDFMWLPCECVHAHAQHMELSTGSKKRSLRTMITLSGDFLALRRTSLGLHPIAGRDSLFCTVIDCHNIHFASTTARCLFWIGQRQRWLLWTHFPRRQRNLSR